MEKYVRKLQLVELEILEEVDRICQENDIKYFLCGGTLLGAIRHKGFIPWDDDIDVLMTRKNYNKFIDVCRKKLDDKYIIDCYKTNKKCSFPFIKIKKKGTLYVEQKNYNNYDDNSGIWIDIFPIDGAKSQVSKFQQKQYKISQYISTLISIKTGSNYYKNSKVKKKIYSIILSVVPYKFMTWAYEKVVSFYDVENSDYLCAFATVYTIEKETYEKKKIFPYENVEFEGRKFTGIKGYDYYLKKLYGDYMKLPPKEKRVNHSPYLIKFEDGEELKFSLDDKYI